MLSGENSTFMCYVQVIETCIDIMFRNILTVYEIAKESFEGAI